jgi:hypothetical protein
MRGALEAGVNQAAPVASGTEKYPALSPWPM